MHKDKLTPKEKRFCEEYLSDFNGTAAYIRAGYKAATNNSAGVEAHKLLRNPKIALRLQQLKAHRSRRVGISQERVLQELARIAFVNMADFINADGNVHLPENFDDMAAVAEVGKKDGEITKIKLHDKIKALTLLMKHLGMLNDFDMAIACLREKYGLSLTRDDDGQWQVVDLSRIQA